MNKSIFEKLAVILALYTVIFIFSLTFNLHFHQLPDGRYVIHSHPNNDSNKSSGQKHDHTSREYVSIGPANSVFSAIPILTTNIVAISIYNEFILIEHTIEFETTSMFLTRLWRSPPHASI